MNMLRIDCNYRQRDSACCVCGEKATTRYLLECTGSTDQRLTTQIYQEIIKK